MYWVTEKKSKKSHTKFPNLNKASCILFAELCNWDMQVLPLHKSSDCFEYPKNPYLN